MVGAAFWQCGRDVAEENTRLQYEEAQPRPASSLAEHLQEFGEAWQGMEREWYASLAFGERDLLDGLTTATEQSAFRIIESWSRHEGNDAQNFHINVEALARRLGISVRGAGKLRRRFCKLGILTKISDYVPHKRSACFAWLPIPLARESTSARILASRQRAATSKALEGRPRRRAYAPGEKPCRVDLAANDF